MRNPPVIRAHHHAELELNLVARGEITYIVGGKRYTFGPRTLLWGIVCGEGFARHMFDHHPTRAEGFIGLGMHERAWAELEDLPPDARTDPRVLDLRLRIATALEKWSMGEVLVSVLEDGETVARFHHTYARHLSLAGDSDSREAAYFFDLSVLLEQEGCRFPGAADAGLGPAGPEREPAQPAQ
jgi:hypothetical protein